MTELDTEARRLFSGPNIAHIATLLPDGGPHSVPVMVDLEGDHIVFFTSPASRKGRNLDIDARVAISITDRDDLIRCAIVRGRLERRVAGEAGWDIVDRIFGKYTGSTYPRAEVREAFLVRPEHVVVPTFG